MADSEQVDPYEKVLHVVVATLMKLKGVDAIRDPGLQILVTALTAMLERVGNDTGVYGEHAGRQICNLRDATFALKFMGFGLCELTHLIRNSPRLPAVKMPEQQVEPKPPQMLQSGSRLPRPPHIPKHMPPMPFEHTVIRTPAYRKVVIDHAGLREKAAVNKRNIENALVNFLTRTSDVDDLFETGNKQFQLIAPKPTSSPYLAALNPTDQIFDFDELEYRYQLENRLSDKVNNPTVNNTMNEPNILPNSTTNRAILANPGIHDNPYLRAPRLPKRHLIDEAELQGEEKTKKKVKSKNNKQEI